MRSYLSGLRINIILIFMSSSTYLVYAISCRGILLKYRFLECLLSFFFFWFPLFIFIIFIFDGLTICHPSPTPATRYQSPGTRHPSPAEKSCREKYGYGCLEARAGLAGHCSSASYRLGYLTIIPRAQIGS